MSDSTDTLIIGAGPIGLELAAALKHAAIDYLHIDAAQIGHTISWYAPGTRFFSSPERLAIAGVPLVTRAQEKPTREEYLDYLRAVAAQFDLRVRTFERADSIDRSGDAFTIKVQAQRGPRTYTARRVILAIGDMHRPRLLNIPGESLPRVSHYLDDPHLYFRRRVLIVGGRNSAVEAAIRLFRIGADVAVSYRNDQFDPQRIKYWLLPEVNWLIQKNMIAFHPHTIPVEITPAVVRLRSTAGAPEHSVEADAVLLLTGYEQDPTLFQRAGIQLTGDNRVPVLNPRTMETNIPGLFVIGTATAGTQSRFKVFIETSHVHIPRVLRALTGQPPPPEPDPTPESGLEA